MQPSWAVAAVFRLLQAFRSQTALLELRLAWEMAAKVAGSAVTVSGRAMSPAGELCTST